MSFLSDNLTAVLLAGLLTILMATTTVRRSEEAQAITSHRSTSGATAALALTVRADFESAVRFESLTDSTVAFAISADPTTGAETTVAYARRTRQGETGYDVQRSVGGGTAATFPEVAGWDVALLDETGAATSNPSAAQQAVVRFRLDPAFATRSDSLAIEWTHTFAPPILAGTRY